MHKVIRWTLLVVFLSTIAATILDFQKPDQSVFTIEHISRSECKEKSDVQLSERLPVFDQPFHYLGHGSQAIAFVSQDGETVLKFFLHKSLGNPKRFKIVSPLRLFPAYQRARQKAKIVRNEKALQKTFKRYIQAFGEMRDETGLIAIHLNKTSGMLPICTLKDLSGREWSLDLNQVPFLIQKKVAPIEEYLRSLETDEQKRKAIQSIMAFLRVRAEKGFRDKIDDFHIDNYGFWGEKVIMHDPGRVEFSEEIKSNPGSEIAKMERLLLQKLSAVSQY